MSGEWHALVATVDGARRDDLVAAMRAQNWHVKVVEDLPEAARLAREAYRNRPQEGENDDG